jgi:ABC-2 type transport system ATP-binding protein
MQGEALVSADARPIRVAGYGDVIGGMTLINQLESPETKIALTPIRAFEAGPEQFATSCAIARSAGESRRSTRRDSEVAGARRRGNPSATRGLRENLGNVDAVIETKGLRRVFKTRQRVVEAVAGVDLTVDRGEIFGFLGPNGAGKTTTLRMLATLMPPSGGTASVAGCDLQTQAGRIRERIGYVGQAGGSDPEITGRRELVFQARLYGMSLAAAQNRSAELITMLELEICADRAAKTYSGGQKRRLDIGLGLVHDPQLLFLDEPTTGLDPQSRARVWDEVRRMHDRGTTVFLTTHYLDEADALCDRIAIIDYGKIVAEGTPEELKRAVAGDVVTLTVAGDQQRALDVIKDEPFVREAKLDEGSVLLYVDRGEVAMPAILRLLDTKGLTLQTIGLHRPSLDDVFLRQTGRSLRETAA